MKLRFESSYQLQLGVNDVDTYVDKYVSKIKCGGLLLSTWENISGQTIGLCLLTGSFAGILGFIYECGKGPVLFTFFTGAWTAIIVNIVDNIVNISAHKQMLRFNLIDYFENNLKVRMEQEVFHPEARRKYQREYFDEDKVESHATESSSLAKRGLNDSKAVAATVELQDETLQENDAKKSAGQTVGTKLSRKDKKKQQKQEKREAKRERQQIKYDAKAAKKKAKEDAVAAKKQAKIDADEAKKKAKADAIEAKKQSKMQSKQNVIDERNMKKAKREEAREAKERAEIKALQLKKQAKLEEKEQREKIEQDRKQKALQNNKAYKEKMRLKEEKEREAAKREERNRQKEIQESKNTELDRLEAESLHEIDESLTKQQLRGAIKEINRDRIKVVEETPIKNETMEYENDQDNEVSEMIATSKEEDLLIEEVLKDFLS